MQHRTYIQSLRGLAFRNVGRRRVRSALSVLGVALGVALVFAALSVAFSAAAEGNDSASEVVHLTVTGRSGQFIPAEVLQQARAVPNVRAVNPMLSFTAVAATNANLTLTLKGVDPAADAAIRTRKITAGGNITAPGDLIVPESWAANGNVKIGDTLVLLIVPDLQALPRPLTARIVGFYTPTDSGPLSAVGITPIEGLQAAAGRDGQASQFEIRLSDANRVEEGLTAMRAALGSGVIVGLSTGNDGTSGMMVINTIINVVLLSSGVAILLTASYMIFNTFAMTLAERRTEIGRMVAIGMTPGQASRQILTEAGIIGVLGAGIGLVLGALLTLPVQAAIRALLGIPFSPAPLSPVAAGIALAIGLGLTVFSTLPIARQAGHISPLEMIFPARVANGKRRNWVLWAGVGTLGLSGLIFTLMLHKDNPVARFMFIPMLLQNLLLIGALLVAPTLLRLWFTRLPTFSRRLAVVIAVGNLRRTPSRAALTASALTVVIAAALMNIGLSEMLAQSNQRNVEDVFAFDYMLTPNYNGNALLAFANNGNFTPSDAKFYDELETFRDRLHISRVSFINAPELIAVPGMPLALAIDVEEALIRRKVSYIGGTADEILARFKAEPSIVLAQSIAVEHGYNLGDIIMVQSKSGPKPFRIAGLDGRMFFSYMDYEQAQALLDSTGLVGYLLTLREGADRVATVEALHSLSGRYNLQLTIITEFRDVFVGVWRGLGTTFAALSVLIMVVAALGILATLYTSVMERRREIGILAAVGGTPAQIRGIVLVEAVIIGISGMALGVLIGLPLGLISSALNDLTDQATKTDLFLTINVFPALIVPVLAVMVGAPLIAALAALIPARRAVRLPVVEAIRYQ